MAVAGGAGNILPGAVAHQSGRRNVVSVQRSLPNGVALQAEGGHASEEKEIRILRAMRRMATDAAFHLDRRMLVRERAGHFPVTRGAPGILFGC